MIRGIINLNDNHMEVGMRWASIVGFETIYKKQTMSPEQQLKSKSCGEISVHLNPYPVYPVYPLDSEHITSACVS